MTRSAYVVVLSKDDPSPLAPGERRGEGRRRGQGQAEKTGDKDKDEEGRRRRSRSTSRTSTSASLALPVPAQNYVGLLAGKAGDALPGRRRRPIAGRRAAARRPPARRSTASTWPSARPRSCSTASATSPSRTTARRCSTARATDVVPGRRRPRRPSRATGRSSSTSWRSASIRGPSGSRCTARSGASSATSSTTRTPTASTWRRPSKKYEPYLAGLGSRHDLNYLFDEMLGELCAAATSTSPAATCRRPTSRKGGLLGADYTVENGRYRFARIYRGENWNPEPAGAADAARRRRQGGRVPARRQRPGPAGRRTTSTGSSRGRPASRRCSRSARTPDGKGSREVTVVPVASETAAAQPGLGRRQPPEGGQADRRPGRLRLPAGHGGRAATPASTATSSPRPASDAVIVDERFNGGGLLADHIIDYLRQPLRNYCDDPRGGRPGVPDVGDLRARR